MEDRAEWLEERRKGIGGSDAAKVLGLSRWGGPFSVYLDKVMGIAEDLSDNEAVHWGNVLEEVVAREFAEREGLEVHKVPHVVTSGDYPFMLANVDRKIAGQNVGLECKTASAYKADEWEGDQLPDEYYVQVQHYCSVMGWEGCWIACLIGGQRFVYKYVPRSERFIAGMIEGERAFWVNHVVPRVPPAVGAFDTVTLEQKGPDMLAATGADIDLAMELAQLKPVLKELEGRKDQLENALKARIGENAGIEGVATFKKTKDTLVTDWQGICLELGASPELIQKYTSVKEGYRRFYLKYKIPEELREAV